MVSKYGRYRSENVKGGKITIMAIRRMRKRIRETDGGMVSSSRLHPLRNDSCDILGLERILSSRKTCSSIDESLATDTRSEPESTYKKQQHWRRQNGQVLRSVSNLLFSYTQNMNDNLVIIYNENVYKIKNQTFLLFIITYRVNYKTC